jgi:hypothetical protein
LYLAEAGAKVEAFVWAREQVAAVAKLSEELRQDQLACLAIRWSLRRVEFGIQCCCHCRNLGDRIGGAAAGTERKETESLGLQQHRFEGAQSLALMKSRDTIVRGRSVHQYQYKTNVERTCSFVCVIATRSKDQFFSASRTRVCPPTRALSNNDATLSSNSTKAEPSSD